MILQKKFRIIPRYSQNAVILKNIMIIMQDIMRRRNMLKNKFVQKGKKLRPCFSQAKWPYLGMTSLSPSLKEIMEGRDSQ